VLHYDAALAAVGFPSPLLRATIGGRRVWLIVDTGASVHTVASWLVSAARLPTRDSTAAVTGSTGTEQPVRVFEAVRARLEDGRTLSIPEGVVVDFPPIFQEHEIGGLLSPQLLTTRDAVVLDLTAPSITFESFATATARVREGGAAEVRACHNAASRFRNRLYAVPVTADGVQATLLVDTGATGTVAALESGIAKRLEAQSVSGATTQGVGGVATSSRRIPNVALTVDRTTTVLDLTIGAVAGACGSDGLLGMDVLKRCVLVLGEPGFSWSCRPGD
jgi:predicted aspartyl protease